MNAKEIITTVARVHCVDIRYITGPQRDAHITAARHAAMTYMREYLGWSTPRIAAAVNRMCHTTVLHGMRTHRRRLRHNTSSARSLDAACRRCLDGVADSEVDVRELMGLEAFQ